MLVVRDTGGTSPHCVVLCNRFSLSHHWTPLVVVAQTDKSTRDEKNGPLASRRLSPRLVPVLIGHSQSRWRRSHAVVWFVVKHFTEINAPVSGVWLSLCGSGIIFRQFVCLQSYKDDMINDNDVRCISGLMNITVKQGCNNTYTGKRVLELRRHICINVDVFSPITLLVTA